MMDLEDIQISPLAASLVLYSLAGMAGWVITGSWFATALSVLATQIFIQKIRHNHEQLRRQHNMYQAPYAAEESAERAAQAWAALDGE